MTVDGNKTVLVIDDDITILKLISYHLKHHGYNVLQATNADEGFDRLNDNKVNLVLCDVTMSGMDGFTFCQKVRENENYSFMPFVFVTAKNSLQDKSKALDVGADDFISKPFEIEELILTVKALLRRSEIYQKYGVRKNLEQNFQQRTLRIVLVDDDAALSKLFQYNLNKAGYDCIIANDAEEGFRQIKSFTPDVIISDIMMPKVDGFEFRKRILNDPEIASIPFIFFTAKGTEKDILEGYDLEITDYVLKTAGPQVVVAKVSAIIKSLNKERQKVVSELHQAADTMRAKVVPEGYPEFDKFKIAHWHVPYSGIPGGDFIDYIRLDDNHLAIILGDVMGKKWGAWYFAFAYAGYVRSAVRTVLETGDVYSPSNILQKVNSSVYQDSKISEVFTTLSVIVLDNKEMILKYSGAGDLPILFKNSVDNTISRIQSPGLLLGFIEEGDFKDSIIKMNSGDCVVLASDGIVESTGQEREQYGSKSLLDVLKNSNDSEVIIENIKKDFTSFTRNSFDDDVSLITIEASS
jgi:sigma-B regulation protein RsbU (phosphoserine phosphatase)